MLCPAIAPDPTMLSPANGATSVPTNIGLIYFAGSASPNEVELTTAAGSSIFGGTFVAAPSPVPSSVASSAGSKTVFEASVPVLNPGTTYTVSVANTPSSCPQVLRKFRVLYNAVGSIKDVVGQLDHKRQDHYNVRRWRFY